ncbi:FAD/NAD(P)-binding protein [bacterium]|jgi:sulfhydrogenase subunit gamma (sulfur reductase)|nr:FAD/NAD(P)-binding protein [bacterium]MBT4121686.1 FAD/NAD(P)-binding protein [bacterium]MBT4335342.1 FAD/NAD(P)-binding protein [bacterium]MBT4495916.1 FAD/NAD(P)-binding protein [bacterium]MBT4764298.1 FAD/NAD(P)-binding protein [bacterium]
MINQYLPKKAKIISIKQETEDVKLFRLKFVKDQEYFYFWHGQFAQIGLPGYGEGPFDICSNSNVSTKYFEISVRKVGFLTSKLHKLKKNDYIYVRGPFGKGWPEPKTLAKKNLLLVGGGCGFVPLKSIIEEVSGGYSMSHKVQVFYGCSDENNVLFKDSYGKWLDNDIDLRLIFDKKKPSNNHIQGISCSFGLITKLFDSVKVVEDASAFLCGPPIMFKFVVAKLLKQGFKEEDIYVSMERKMYCATGVCQHCAMGEKYVCKDGPVFNYPEVKNYI